ncbi:MAG: transposase, partial [bacterium]|nr:transposase [bacterium]
YLEELSYEASLAATVRIDLEWAQNKGMEKGLVKVAKKSLKEGLSLELISKLTGLSKEELEKLSETIRT